MQVVVLQTDESLFAKFTDGNATKLNKT